MMKGILCVDKPRDFTSFDVIAKLRGILHIRRLGHGGTLDPMATGVLPVFVGSATKACDIMPDTNKSYLAGFRLGQTTDTQDITGKVLTNSDKPVSYDDICAVLPDFMGKIMQIPPMYSAVQVGGKRLYDLARQGIEVDREARDIEVTGLRIVRYDEETREGTLEIDCGKGTYVRTIIHDIGEKLGCGGIMTSLVRTSSGGFSYSECHTLEEIQQAADQGMIEEFIIPVERIFQTLPKLRLNPAQTRMYSNGVKLDISRVNNILPDADRYGVYGAEVGFIGTAVVDREVGVLRVEKNFI